MEVVGDGFGGFCWGDIADGLGGVDGELARGAVFEGEAALVRGAGFVWEVFELVGGMGLGVFDGVAESGEVFHGGFTS